MTDSYQAYVSVVGRVLLAIMFVLAGLAKLSNIDGTATYMASGGLPSQAALAAVVGAFEVIAGLALLVGYQVRWAGLALAVFTLCASVLFHAYWSAPPEQHVIVQLLFMKNLAVAGGLLVASALGGGPYSLDARRAKR